MGDLGYHYFWKHPYDIVNHYMSFILAQHLGRFSCSRGWRLAVNLPGEAPFWTNVWGRCRKRGWQMGRNGVWIVCVPKVFFFCFYSICFYWWIHDFCCGNNSLDNWWLMMYWLFHLCSNTHNEQWPARTGKSTSWFFSRTPVWLNVHQWSPMATWRCVPPHRNVWRRFHRNTTCQRLVSRNFVSNPIVCWVPLVSLRMVCMMCVPIFMNAMDDEAS